MEYITPELFEYCENSNTKIAKRVYDNVLNYDLLQIVQDREVYWIEKTWSGAIIPEYAYTFIEKWAKKRGLVYLYSIKTTI